MGYMDRKPTSNEKPHPSGSRWLEANGITDEVALLLGGHARRCSQCRRSARTKYLDSSGRCPDCSGTIPEIRREEPSGGYGCSGEAGEAD